MKRYFVLLLFLLGCSLSSLYEVRKEADYLMESISKELKRVEKQEDLKKLIPLLSYQFEKLADLVILADSFEEEFDLDESKGSIELHKQLKRIYQMHEGRRQIEKAQLNGLKKLERYFNPD